MTFVARTVCCGATLTRNVRLCLLLLLGMRGAFGKPAGTVARVDIGQPLLSVRCKDANLPHCIEALRRAKFKFPGRQVCVWARLSLPFLPGSLSLFLGLCGILLTVAARRGVD